MQMMRDSSGGAASNGLASLFKQENNSNSNISASTPYSPPAGEQRWDRFVGALTRVNGVSYSNSPPSSRPSLEYLFEDEYTPTGPSWGARICYGAGTAYLSALPLGGLWGLWEGMRSKHVPLGVSPAFAKKLRWNAVLNACTARGPFVANSVAILALMYNLIHGATIKGRGGKYDVGSAVGSAALTGIVYKSTAGWKSAMKMGGVLGLGMAAYQVVHILRNEVF